jgi:hypothetical protein
MAGGQANVNKTIQTPAPPPGFGGGVSPPAVILPQAGGAPSPLALNIAAQAPELTLPPASADARLAAATRDLRPVGSYGLPPEKDQALRWRLTNAGLTPITERQYLEVLRTLPPSEPARQYAPSPEWTDFPGPNAAPTTPAPDMTMSSVPVRLNSSVASMIGMA